MDLGENIRKIVMAGVGAASVVVEKSQEAIDTLSQKGEEVVKQGKAAGEEFCREARKARKDDLLDALEDMTREERAEVAERIAELNARDGARERDE